MHKKYRFTPNPRYGAEGEYEVVICDGEKETGKPLPLRLDLVNHSPTGFSHGYLGSGPAQLALAILADLTGDDQLAVALHQEFKHKVISMLPQAQAWELSETEIRNWIAAQSSPND